MGLVTTAAFCATPFRNHARDVEQAPDAVNLVRVGIAYGLVLELVYPVIILPHLLQLGVVKTVLHFRAKGLIRLSAFDSDGRFDGRSMRPNKSCRHAHNPELL